MNRTGRSSRRGGGPGAGADRVRDVTFYGYLGSGNIGNDASLETVLDWVRTRHPQLTPACITLAPDAVAARYGLPATRLSWSPAHLGGERVHGLWHKLLGRLLDVGRSLRLAAGTDMVVVPGMGVLEANLGAAPWGLPYWMALMALACRVRGTRFDLVCVGAEPVSQPVTRWLFRKTVSWATHVSYRDEWSASAMRTNGSRAPHRVAADLAFAHPYVPDRTVEPGLVVVGVMAYYGAGNDPVRGAGLHRRYVDALGAAVRTLLLTGRSVVLVVGDRADTAVTADVAAAARQGLATEVAARLRISEAATFAELSDEMAAAEVVVASRFHNLVCAVRLRRPVVSVGYAVKADALMRELGLGTYTSRPELLEADWLVGRIDDALRDGAAISRSLRAATELRRGQVLGVLDDLAESAGQGRATASEQPVT